MNYAARSQSESAASQGLSWREDQQDDWDEYNAAADLVTVSVTPAHQGLAHRQIIQKMASIIVGGAQ
jgi:hypothetical protein